MHIPVAIFCSAALLGQSHLATQPAMGNCARRASNELHKEDGATEASTRTPTTSGVASPSPSEAEIDELSFDRDGTRELFWNDFHLRLQEKGG